MHLNIRGSRFHGNTYYYQEGNTSVCSWDTLTDAPHTSPLGLNDIFSCHSFYASVVRQPESKSERCATLTQCVSNSSSCWSLIARNGLLNLLVVPPIGFASSQFTPSNLIPHTRKYVSWYTNKMRRLEGLIKSGKERTTARCFVLVPVLIYEYMLYDRLRCFRIIQPLKSVDS